jgi:cbb3-type cytochrome oxidase subunit 3
MIGAPYSIFVIGVLVAFFAYRNARRHRMEHEVSPPAP